MYIEVDWPCLNKVSTKADTNQRAEHRDNRGTDVARCNGLLL